ncbi:unnamed protein product [Danaus chrysippus]|uniref:(African queen) hypothetical protein n=1 Tax=Danaus chrysippus TaxID=151541 RepID=A0A8J2VRM0_9NEOP|nr:unnamed protein product [Danaus chrysippus]
MCLYCTYLNVEEGFAVVERRQVLQVLQAMQEMQVMQVRRGRRAVSPPRAECSGVINTSPAPHLTLATAPRLRCRL